MKIIITLFHLIVLGVVIAIIGIGAGYWGYGMLNSNQSLPSQQDEKEQSPVSDNDNGDVTDSGAPDINQFTDDIQFIKGDIAWEAPRIRESLDMVSPANNETTVSYSTVGIIKKAGIFNGDELVIVNVEYGMDSQIYYVIAHQGMNYIITSKSSDPVGYTIVDNQSTIIASTITLEELDFPETIYGPKPRQTLKRYNPFWGAIHWFDRKDKIPAFTHPDYGTVYENKAHGFSFQSPDGTEIAYALVIDFMNEDGVPQVTWNDGIRNKDSYISTDIGGCGDTNAISVVTDSDIDSAYGLVKAGVNTQGDSVWELKNSQHELLKKIHDEQYIVYQEGEQKISYDEFVKRHPVFFWKDPFGRIIKFQKQGFLPVAECAKPVIYLYPEHEQRVAVDLRPEGGFTYSEPRYENGWDVRAFPDGRLVDNKSGKEYSYLFWEGRGGYYETPKKGFVVEQSGVEDLLREKLALIGLNRKETQDFVDYWVPEMQTAPYYFVTFMGNQTMDVLAPLAVTPQPDTVIRVLMDFIPLDQPIDVEPLVLRTIPRKGFTVVEWGGVRHGERQ